MVSFDFITNVVLVTGISYIAGLISMGVDDNLAVSQYDTSGGRYGSENW